MADIVRRAEAEPTLARWDPFDAFERLQHAFAPWAGYFAPSFDVKETADAYLFKADLPGLKEDDIDISLTGNRLTISGERHAEEREEGETYYSVERSHGTFSRTFTVPEGCDLDHVTADLRDGVLTVAIPKGEAVKPRRISLKGAKEGLKGTMEGLKEKVPEKMKS